MWTRFFSKAAKCDVHTHTLSSAIYGYFWLCSWCLAPLSPTHCHTVQVLKYKKTKQKQNNIMGSTWCEFLSSQLQHMEWMVHVRPCLEWTGFQEGEVFDIKVCHHKFSTTLTKENLPASLHEKKKNSTFQTCKTTASSSSSPVFFSSFTSWPAHVQQTV